MKTLQHIFEELQAQGFETDKGSVHSYITVYEDLLAPYRDTAKNILEIGVFKGNSLRMWQQYFSGTVHGIDCDSMPHDGMADLRDMIASGEFNINIFDATDKFEVGFHFERMQFDVIIEDANHQLSQQLQLFHIFKEYLAPGGIYIIEDIENIDVSADVFITIDPNSHVMVVDLRENKNRFDDVLVIIKPKKCIHKTTKKK